MASWIPGLNCPGGEVDWEAYRKRINETPESPHQAAIAPTPKTRRSAKESESNG